VGVAQGSHIAELNALSPGRSGGGDLGVPVDHCRRGASAAEFTLFQKELKGNVFGGANPRADIPKLLDLYRNGLLKLDELVTTTYKLEDVNQGYQDMLDGKNIRGLILHDI